MVFFSYQNLEGNLNTGGRGSSSGGGSKITIHGVKVDLNSMQSMDKALEKLGEKVIELNRITQNPRKYDEKERHKARESMNHLMARRWIILNKKYGLNDPMRLQKTKEALDRKVDKDWEPLPKKELKYPPTLGEVRRGKKFIREVLTRMGVK